MDTALTPKLERLIRERLQTGSYQSATEVLEDALDALAERENFEAIRAELDHADEQLAHGEYTEYCEDSIERLAEDVKSRGRARLAEDHPSGAR
jgi:putative addiction module CopG family antidote